MNLSQNWAKLTKKKDTQFLKRVEKVKGEGEMEGTRRRGGGRAIERKVGGAWRLWFERRRSNVEAIIGLYEEGWMFPPQSTAASNEKIHKVKLNFMRERERERDEEKPVNGSSHWVGKEQRKRFLCFVSLSEADLLQWGQTHQMRTTRQHSILFYISFTRTYFWVFMNFKYIFFSQNFMLGIIYY